MTMAQSIGGDQIDVCEEAAAEFFTEMQTKANSPLELFEQFEQSSDDLRLWTKGGKGCPGWDKQNVEWTQASSLGQNSQNMDAIRRPKMRLLQTERRKQSFC